MSGMQKKFNEWFLYDSEKGELVWKKTKNSRGLKGNTVGALDKSYDVPRLVLKLDRKKYYVSRVIWCMIYGDIEEGLVIDHINGDPLDNRLQNLRAVTASENSRNRTLSNNNTSGFTGVRFVERCNKWRASIWTKGTFRHLGHYDTKEEAIAARIGGEKALGYLTHKRVPTQETDRSHLDSSRQ